MSSKSHNYKKFFRKYKVIIILSLFFLFFPLLLYMIYRLIYCCYPPFEAGVLLPYYGTTFGIFGSFVTFYLTDKKEKETRNAEIKPKITVDLKKEDEKVFKLTVYNCLQTPARNVFLYDEILDSKIEKYTTVYVTYNLPNDEFNKYKEIYKNCQNITLDEDIIENGYPKYILIDCDDVDGRMWQCEFNKIVNGSQIAYMNSNVCLV